jgi:hypothetical protein
MKLRFGLGFVVTTSATLFAAPGGKAVWNGTYTNNAPSALTEGLMCPGDGGDSSAYTVADGKLSFVVRWVDHHKGGASQSKRGAGGGVLNGDRTINVSVPLQPNPKLAHKSDNDPVREVTFEQNVPIDTITIADGETKIAVDHLEVHGSLWQFAPKNANPPGTFKPPRGRMGSVDVDLGKVSETHIGCSAYRALNADWVKAEHGPGCAIADTQCTADSDCCSGTCGAGVDKYNNHRCE